MVGGFMAGVSLGQKIMGMNKFSNQIFSQGQNQIFNQKQIPTQNQKLQSAKIAAYKRMIARQNQFDNSSMTLPTIPNFEQTNSRQSKGRGQGRGKKNFDSTPDDFIFNQDFNQLKDDGPGLLLNSLKNNFGEINAWIKKNSHGLLDLNMSLALFFIIRGIRRLILEKQYPNAWQMIWWAMSILRGWRFI